MEKFEADIFFTERRGAFSGVKEPYRSDYDIDKARIIHSEAFRRLQSKTQVLQVSESDFHRNRLTHSVEVAQIGKGIARFIRYQYANQLEKYNVNLDDDLIEAICLAHDIGHPPFGHGGEIALNYMMRNEGGFEGNGQTLRIISKLEKYSDEHGMNLTRRAALGLLKYPNPFSTVWDTTQVRQTVEEWKPAKCYYNEEKEVVEWILQPFSASDQRLFTSLLENPTGEKSSHYKSFDCSIMELADDIAYATHDFEDGLELGLFNEDWKNKFFAQIFQNKKFMGYLKTVKQFSEAEIEKLKSLHSPKKFISMCIGFFIYHIELEESNVDFQNPYLLLKAQLHPEASQMLQAFKDIVDLHIIQSEHNLEVVKKGQMIVCHLFDVFLKDPSLLPEDTRRKYETSDRPHRVICDYIAGMTDRYADKLYSKLNA